ncbi:hypothetical protein [Faecalibacillus intestinalis]|uniref:hypothetical protein n=1 Tax=Faecalibacillus intestinalis TaxID=1982626 RepID=UPI00295E26C6|nr:hypothetical protein [Faecalibacillus intestinalis]
MKKEKDSLVMDYLFSVIMALVLLCSQNFIDIPILSYFGSITLLIFTFVLFVDLFPERYKNKKMIACFLILSTLFIILMAASVVGRPFEDYTLSGFINNLIQTMSVFAIVSDFAQKDRLNTFCRKIENKFKIK